MSLAFAWRAKAPKSRRFGNNILETALAFIFWISLAQCKAFSSPKGKRTRVREAYLQHAP